MFQVTDYLLLGNMASMEERNCYTPNSVICIDLTSEEDALDSGNTRKLSYASDVHDLCVTGVALNSVANSVEVSRSTTSNKINSSFSFGTLITECMQTESFSKRKNIQADYLQNKKLKTTSNVTDIKRNLEDTNQNYSQNEHGNILKNESRRMHSLNGLENSTVEFIEDSIQNDFPITKSEIECLLRISNAAYLTLVSKKSKCSSQSRSTLDISKDCMELWDNKKYMNNCDKIIVQELNAKDEEDIEVLYETKGKEIKLGISGKIPTTETCLSTKCAEILCDALDCCKQMAISEASVIPNPNSKDKLYEDSKTEKHQTVASINILETDEKSNPATLLDVTKDKSATGIMFSNKSQEQKNACIYNCNENLDVQFIRINKSCNPQVSDNDIDANMNDHILPTETQSEELSLNKCSKVGNFGNISNSVEYILNENGNFEEKKKQHCNDSNTQCVVNKFHTSVVTNMETLPCKETLDIVNNQECIANSKNITNSNPQNALYNSNSKKTNLPNISDSNLELSESDSNEKIFNDRVLIMNKNELHRKSRKRSYDSVDFISEESLSKLKIVLYSNPNVEVSDEISIIKQLNTVQNVEEIKILSKDELAKDTQPGNNIPSEESILSYTDTSLKDTSSNLLIDNEIVKSKKDGHLLLHANESNDLENNPNLSLHENKNKDFALQSPHISTTGDSNVKLNSLNNSTKSDRLSQSSDIEICDFKQISFPVCYSSENNQKYENIDKMSIDSNTCITNPTTNSIDNLLEGSQENITKENHLKTTSNVEISNLCENRNLNNSPVYLDSFNPEHIKQNTHDIVLNEGFAQISQNVVADLSKSDTNTLRISNKVTNFTIPKGLNQNNTNFIGAETQFVINGRNETKNVIPPQVADLHANDILQSNLINDTVMSESSELELHEQKQNSDAASNTVKNSYFLMHQTQNANTEIKVSDSNVNLLKPLINIVDLQNLQNILGTVKHLKSTLSTDTCTHKEYLNRKCSSMESESSPPKNSKHTDFAHAMKSTFHNYGSTSMDKDKGLVENTKLKLDVLHNTFCQNTDKIHSVGNNNPSSSDEKNVNRNFSPFVNVTEDLHAKRGDGLLNKMLDISPCNTLFRKCSPAQNIDLISSSDGSVPSKNLNKILDILGSQVNITGPVAKSGNLSLELNKIALPTNLKSSESTNSDNQNKSVKLSNNLSNGNCESLSIQHLKRNINGDEKGLASQVLCNNSSPDDGKKMVKNCSKHLSVSEQNQIFGISACSQTDEKNVKNFSTSEFERSHSEQEVNRNKSAMHQSVCKGIVKNINESIQKSNGTAFFDSTSNGANKEISLHSSFDGKTRFKAANADFLSQEKVEVNSQCEINNSQDMFLELNKFSGLGENNAYKCSAYNENSQTKAYDKENYSDDNSLIFSDDTTNDINRSFEGNLYDKREYIIKWISEVEQSNTELLTIETKKEVMESSNETNNVCTEESLPAVNPINFQLQEHIQSSKSFTPTNNISASDTENEDNSVLLNKSNFTATSENGQIPSPGNASNSFANTICATSHLEKPCINTLSYGMCSQTEIEDTLKEVKGALKTDTGDIAGKHSVVCLVPKQLKQLVGHKIMDTESVMLLMLEWRVSWLGQQLKTNPPPPICRALKKVANTYICFEQYYNTYFPLMLLDSWHRIFVSWKDIKHPSIYLCEISSHSVRSPFVNFECQSVVHNPKVLPSEGKLAIIAFDNSTQESNNKVFGYITRVRTRAFNYNSDSKLHTYKQFNDGKSERLTVLILTVRIVYNLSNYDFNLPISVEVLCSNIRTVFKQNDAMLYLKKSPLYDNILNPTKEIQYFELTPLNSDYKEAFKSVCNITQSFSVSYPIPSLVVVRYKFESDRLRILPLLIENLKAAHMCKILLCERTVKSLNIVAENISQRKSLSMVIVSKRCEVNNKLIKYLLNEHVESVNVNRDSSPGGALVTKKSVLQTCDVIVTLIRNSHDTFLNEAIANYQNVAHLCCIVDEASLCTENDTLIPVMHGISKLILIGNPDSDARTLSNTSNAFDYHKSFFHRVHTLHTTSK